MKLNSIALALGLLCPLIGCDLTEDEDSPADTDGSPNGSASGGNASSGGPSAGAVDGCRDACDNLQFFDCIDGSTHETCWNACAERNDGDLELFRSCVNNSAPACDPDCLDSLLDAPEPEPEPETTTTAGGDSSSCETVCQAYVDAGCELEFIEGIASCAQACASLSPVEQSAFAVCFSDPQTCEIDEACLEEEEEEGEEEEEVEESGAGDESGGSTDIFCLGACDDSFALQCIDAQQHADCYDQCEIASVGDASAFVSCVDAVGVACDGSCYAVFVG